MDENYAALFQRIREKCQHKRWYGPDMDDPFKKQRWARESDPDTYVAYYWYNQDGQKYTIDKDTDLSHFPSMNNFAFPPATEGQLAATEQALGFALPQLLRMLYTTVANGGFGPGYGLNGSVGGFGDTLAANYQYAKKTNRLVDITLYEKRQGPTQRLQLPFYVHPDRFLELCHWGCAIYSFLDCARDRVFRGAAYREFYGFTYEATSLFEWLDVWSKDQLQF